MMKEVHYNRTSSIAYPLRLYASGFAIAGHWNLIDVDIRR